MGEYVSLRGKLRSVGITDAGKVREHNEDAIAWDGEIGLFVLADGMGGYNAGEVASGIAVKTIMNLVRESYGVQELAGQDKASGLSRPAIILRDAIARANKIINQTAKTQPQCEGMGTTVVAHCSTTIKSSLPTSATRACIGCVASASSRSPWTTRCCRSWWTAGSIPPRRHSGSLTRIM
jgi:serine/threonine protein phosphatase PrpC